MKFKIYPMFFWMITGFASCQQVSTGPSLDETLAYLNSNVSWKISISPNHQELLFDKATACGKNNKYICGTWWKFPIRLSSQMKVRNSCGASSNCSVSLFCPDEASCISESYSHTMNAGKELGSENNFITFSELATSDDVEVGDRLVRATERLLSLLTAQYEAENRDRKKNDNDPFK